ncbi:MAG: hypothetical protein AAGU11_14005 [Syntrophobacteraceae bacterium]
MEMILEAGSLLKWGDIRVAFSSEGEKCNHELAIECFKVRQYPNIGRRLIGRADRLPRFFHGMERAA